MYPFRSAGMKSSRIPTLIPAPNIYQERWAKQPASMTASTIKKIAIVISAIAAILVLVPFEPRFPDQGLDWSWAYAMNVAVARGLQFGHDIVFTYGPLASISTHLYHPATDAGMIVGSLILAAAVFMVFWGSCDRRHLLWLLALPVVLSQQSGLDPVFIMLPPMFLLFCIRNGFSDGARATTIMLTAAAFGLMPLVKGSFTPAVVICGCATLPFLWRQSRALVFGAAAVFVLALLSGWLLSGQHLGGLLTYFVSQQPIVSGYSDAMSYKGPIEQVAVFAVVAILLLVAIRRAETKTPWFVVGAIALILFLAFKAGFVRHDAHAMGAGYALLFLGFFVVLWAPGRFSFATLIAAAIACVFITASYVETTPATMAGKFVGSITSSIRGMHARVFNRTLFAEKLDAADEQIRAAIPLPRTDGSADIFPIDLGALFANRIDWAPRPILQSYSAYTSKLAELNRQHLEASGPDRVFFRTRPIDGRFPTLEDGASWLPLLERYSAAGFSGEFAILDRRAGTDRIIETPIITIGSHLGESISLQGMEGPIFVRIEMGPTIIGRLLNLAFKPPELRIALTYANGDHADFRYVAGMGASGFLLSPTVTTKEQFVALRSTLREDYFRDSMPVSFKIYEAEYPGLAWRSLFAAKLTRLSIPTDESADALLFAEPTQVASLEGFKKTSDCFVDRANDVGPNAPLIPRHGRSFKLRGWGVVPGRVGLRSDNFSLAFVDADGAALVYPLKKAARPDVAAHLGRPDEVMVGFEGSLNIKRVAGSREVRVLQTRGADQYVCEQSFRLADLVQTTAPP